MTTANRPDRRLAQLRRMAWWLDEAIPIPGTSLRFGLDPIMGLVPGLGDAIGLILGGWIVVEAWRRGVPRLVLLRMVRTLALDGLVGTIPILGDILDVRIKANRRNIERLERHSAPLSAEISDVRSLTLIGLGLFGATALVILLASFIFSKVILFINA